jgi:hypothetical protein
MLFVDKLEKYYNDASSFQKQIILFCAVNNDDCNPDRFMILYDKQTEITPYLRRAMMKNFLVNYKTQNYGKTGLLPEITDKDIIHIDTKIRELDGTLLCDIIWDFMRRHKIFN